MGYLTQQLPMKSVDSHRSEAGNTFFAARSERIEGDNFSIDAVVQGTMRYRVQIQKTWTDL
jgi:hypothetical protein